MQLMTFAKALEVAESAVVNAKEYYRRCCIGEFDYTDKLEAKQELDKATKWRDRVKILRNAELDKKQNME